MICTVALARRFAPLVRQRGLALLAESLGIEVGVTHRALPDALTCARILCALFGRLCAHAATVGDAVELLRPRSSRGRRERGERPRARRRPPEDRPDLSQLPHDPGVYVFRDVRGRPLYVGKSVSLRTRARSHFCAPAGWTERAEIVDYKPTNSELGALVLENRLIKEWRPPGNRALKRTDRWVYLRCRLDIPYPVLEVSPEPAEGLAVSVGPAPRPDRRARAGRPPHVAVQAAPLRPGDAPPRPPVALRPDGPMLLTLPRRPRPQRLPPAGGRGAGPVRRPRRRPAAARPPPAGDARRLGRAALRTGRGAAAALRAPRVAAGPAGRHAALGPRRATARARPPPLPGALRRAVDRERARGRLGRPAHRAGRGGTAHRKGARAPAAKGGGTRGGRRDPDRLGVAGRERAADAGARARAHAGAAGALRATRSAANRRRPPLARQPESRTACGCRRRTAWWPTPHSGRARSPRPARPGRTRCRRRPRA